MTFSFPNPAGSYDDVKRRVRFLGHDTLSEKDPWAYAMIALPHAVSDSYSNFTTMKISALLQSMQPFS